MRWLKCFSFFTPLLSEIVAPPSKAAPRTRSVGRSLHSMLFLCLAPMTLWAIVQGRHIQAQEAAPIGKFTSEQAIQRAAPVFWKLMDRAPSLTLSADPAIVPSTETNLKPRWTVSCWSERGKELAVVSFDAETSRLRSATVLIDRPPVAHNHTSRKKATRIAEDWLNSLGPGEGSSRWAVCEATMKSHSWAIRLRSGSRHATAMVDLESSRFCSVVLSP